MSAESATPPSSETLKLLPEAERAYIEGMLADRARLEQKAAERDELLKGLADLHAQYLEAHESEMLLHAQLGNVYVSASQLSSTSNRDEVLTSIQEIVANLIGSEMMGIFELSKDGQWLELLAHIGIDPDQHRRCAVGHPMIQEAIRTLSTVKHPNADDPSGTDDLVACVPLHVGKRPVGAVLIYELLPQKSALENSDVDLLELIGTLGGHALYCTQLEDLTRQLESEPFHVRD